MLYYHQDTGFFTGLPNGQVFTGYSGTGKGRNAPAMQAVAGVGPIPKGVWKIGPAYHHPVLGVLTMDLEPMPGTDTFGRSLFRIHGNDAENDASHGCIILPAWIRVAINKLPPDQRFVTVV